MNTVEATFWEPYGAGSHTRALASVDDVETLAEDLLSRYQEAGDMLPGIELGTSDESGSLAIAVAGFGWALIHSDADLNQHCTRSGLAVSGDSLDTRWDQPTSVPRAWFVPKQTALVGVSRWLADGGLAPELPWSDQCY